MVTGPALDEESPGSIPGGAIREPCITYVVSGSQAFRSLPSFCRRFSYVPAKLCRVALAIPPSPSASMSIRVLIAREQRVCVLPAACGLHVHEIQVLALRCPFDSKRMPETAVERV